MINYQQETHPVYRGPSKRATYPQKVRLPRKEQETGNTNTSETNASNAITLLSKEVSRSQRRRETRKRGAIKPTMPFKLNLLFVSMVFMARTHFTILNFNENPEHNAFEIW